MSNYPKLEKPQFDPEDCVRELFCPICGNLVAILNVTEQHLYILSFPEDHCYQQIGAGPSHGSA